MVEVVQPAPAGRPSLTVSALIFSDGTKVSIGENDLVLFVGPNNSGKSMALRQIERLLGEENRYNVINECEVRKIGSYEQFVEDVKTSSQYVSYYNRWKYVGYKFAIDSSIPDFTKVNDSDVRDYFVLRCGTDTRLSDSQPTKAIAYRNEQPSHPIHLLVVDRELERRLDNVFHKAFGKHIYVNRAGGSEVGLFVGDTRRSELPDDDFSQRSIEFFQEDATSLGQQGDGMRSFATVALNTIAISQQSVLLIDEPEAFLHPPQARLIGRMIAAEAGRLRQIFVATHSADVLKGVVESSSRNIHLLRITRNGNINHIKALNSDLTRELSSDSLIRHSGIIDGIFFRHVVICESDTDCQFYSEMMSLDSVSGNIEPDVLFVQASGKHRLNKLASVSYELGIPFSIIVDIDILNEKGLFRETIKSVGGDWDKVEPLWKTVHDAISSQRVSLTAGQLVTTIEETVFRLKQGDINIKDFLAEVREKIRANSPWDNVKRSGRAALPMGEIVQRFDDLLRICGESGLWIVPEGELEGFCRTIKSRKGSQWIIELLETKDLETSSELSEARSFSKRIWDRIAT